MIIQKVAAKCSNGTFVGRTDGSGIVTWKGVPYAKQPIGKLRFKVAEAAEEEYDPNYHNHLYCIKVGDSFK